MKKSTRQSVAVAFGAIGIVLTFIACGLAVVSGIVMMIAYSYVYGAGLTTMLAGIVLFFTFIVGFVAIMAHSARTALASAIMSVICATAIICCMGVPFQGKGMYAAPIISAILAFAAFIMFTLFSVNVPVRMKNIREKDFQRDKFELQNQLQQELKMLNADFANNIITQEEYNERKQAIFNRRYDYLEKTQNTASHKTATQKQTACAFAIPSAIMAVIFVIVIPCVHFGVCKFAYEGLLGQMSDMKDGYGFIFVHSDYNKFNRLLPDSYKDVAEIRAEKESYKVDECLSALLGYGSYGKQNCGYRARVAYKQLRELQKIDSRWGFDTVIEDCEALVIDAMWSGDGAYLSFYFDEQKDDWVLNTNLPYSDNSNDSWYIFSSAKKGSYSITNDDSWSLIYFNVQFSLSDFEYNEETGEFSINVYCCKDRTTYTMTYTDKHIWSDFEW